MSFWPKELTINLNVKHDESSSSQEILSLLRQIFSQGQHLMAKVDDLLAVLARIDTATTNIAADIKNSQADAATAAADLANDVDALLALVQAGSSPDPEVVAAVTEIQTTARAQADALAATSQKFPAPPTP